MEIRGSAYRRGATDSDIHHAWRNPIRVVFQDDTTTMNIGADTNGRLLEVGFRSDDNTLTGFHAMAARTKFLR